MMKPVASKKKKEKRKENLTNLTKEMHTNSINNIISHNVIIILHHVVW